MIVVDTHAGLADRMQVIEAGLAFSKFTKQPLVVLWPINDQLGCRLGYLFKQKRIAAHIIANDKDILRFQPGSTTDYDYCYDQKMLGAWTPRIDNDFCSFFGKPSSFYTGKDIYIRSWTQFFPSDGHPYRSFKPRSRIQRMIARNVRLFRQTVGVHIRRTDNKCAIELSKLDYFMARMEHFAVKGIATNFFLATDCEKVLGRVKQHFDVIHTPRMEYSRNSRNGMAHAAVDMISLSRTKLILQSHGSEFSTVAARMGNTPHFRVGEAEFNTAKNGTLFLKYYAHKLFRSR